MDTDAMHERRWWALAVMCLCLLLISIDNTVLNVALPSLIVDLGATTGELQWIVDGYTLVFAGLLLTMGSVGDRFGRRRALTVGLVVFGASSAASALCTSPTQLVLTRATLGVGAALIMPATLSLLTNIFTDPRERARAIGTWAAVVGGGGALGPLLGGALLTQFWWGSVFLVNVPLIAVALVGVRQVLPESKDHDAPRLDVVGAGLSVIALVVLLWAIIEGPETGWTARPIVVALVAGVALVGAFATWELRRADPMLDLRFFRSARFSAANAAITLAYFAMIGMMFLTTQFLQTIMGYSPFGAGLRVLPMAAVLLVLIPFAPRMAERFGTTRVVGAGLLISSVGMALTGATPADHGYPYLVGSLMVVAVGMSMVLAPATEAVMGSLPREKAGVGSAMNDTTRQIGAALGVAVIGSVFASSYRPGITGELRRLGVGERTIDGARESAGAAMEAARALPGPARMAIDAAVRQEFASSYRIAALVATAALVAAALVVFRFLPARAGGRVPPSGRPAGGRLTSQPSGMLDG